MRSWLYRLLCGHTLRGYSRIVSVDGGEWQIVRCLECGKTWIEP